MESGLPASVFHVEVGELGSLRQGGSEPSWLPPALLRSCFAGFESGKVALELLHQGVAFGGVLQHLLVEHGLHEQDLGDVVGLLALVLGEQRVELFEFGRQVGFGLLALPAAWFDFADQRP